MSCPDCFRGTLRGDVIPAGREETLHGLETYVTGPDPGVTPLGIVVILADAFGWKLRNTRALADAYARRVPCTVYVPDVFHGNAPPERFMTLLEFRPLPGDSAITKWLKQAWSYIQVAPLLARFAIYNRDGVTRPRVEEFLRGVRSSGVGDTPPKVAIAGFCWGGLYAVRLTHDVPANKVTVNGVEYPVVDCAFTAHPAQIKVPEHLEAAVQPLSVANGDDDEWMGRKKMEGLTAVLEGKNEAMGKEVHEVVVYPSAKHGFAVRGDLDDPLQRERGEQSEDQAVRWFQRHFGNRGGS